MSVSSSLDLVLGPKCGQTKFIQSLTSAGWGGESGERLVFFGIDNMVEVFSCDLSLGGGDGWVAGFENVLKKMSVKVTMVMRHTVHGGDFLFFKDGGVSFVPNIHRVIDRGRATAVSWYVRSIVLAVLARGCAVESWVWSETV